MTVPAFKLRGYIGLCDHCCFPLHIPVALIELKDKPNLLVHPACKDKMIVKDKK